MLPISLVPLGARQCCSLYHVTYQYCYVLRIFFQRPLALMTTEDWVLKENACKQNGGSSGEDLGAARRIVGGLRFLVIVRYCDG